MKALVFTFCLYMLGFSLIAQTTEEESEKKPVQFSFQFGSSSIFDTQTEVDQFESLFPESKLLMNRNPDLKRSSASNADASFYLNLGLHFPMKQKGKRLSEFRFLLSIQSTSILSSNLFLEDRITYDTLTSSKGSEPVYVDSIYTESLDMDLNLNQIALDVSYLNYWAGESKLTFYAGLGLISGLSVNSEVAMNWYSSNSEEYYLNDEDFFTQNEDDYLEESEFKSKGVYFFVQPYLPIGLDIRLSKKRSFLEQTHFFFEARPGLSIVSNDELGTLVNPALQVGMGFKVHFPVD